ncbi:glycosyltransferase [Microbacterium paludicola]|uniref:Glycosyltransferase n=1 Tax=Microbacterium paludicola TaxID=300019 RepID=A0A4Y9FPY9_9MICO|nr:glycosyltransferase family 4 protein [Microbacterium paludicola]MBF0817525.1 glycosyltransferase family 4 protein [Microbacterium paludicola]TFU30922.1 glycosyltransferase [Microbacterium paludicola]
MPARPEVLTVAHVAHTVERGGAELALARLLGSPCRDWDARLVLPRPGDADASGGADRDPDPDAGAFAGLEARGVHVIRAGSPQRPGASRATPWAAVRFAASLVRQALAIRRSGAFRGAHVVHANSTRAAVYAALALTGTRAPLVVHLRDRGEPEAMGRIGFLAFRRTAVRRAAGFIANSASTAGTVRPFLRRGQFVEVVPSPIGMPVADPGPGRSGSEAAGAPVRIGMVARLDPWKGQEELIRAYAAAGVDDRATLTLVGGPAFGHAEHERRLRALAAELGLRNVTFAGHRDDVRERIDALDVCVQYSTRAEPLGQNVLQYLARGRAVIAAAEGGPAEWIADGVNGLLVAPRNVDALAGALRRLVDDASLREALAAAAPATEGLMDDCAVARRHAEVFERAVFERGVVERGVVERGAARRGAGRH